MATTNEPPRHPGDGWVPEQQFGDRLRRVRRHAGLTLAELAERTDISHQQLSRWESGRTPQDPVGVARTIAKATGCSVEWLVLGDWQAWMPDPLQALTGRQRDQLVAARANIRHAEEVTHTGELRNLVPITGCDKRTGVAVGAKDWGRNDGRTRRCVYGTCGQAPAGRPGRGR